MVTTENLDRASGLDTCAQDRCAQEPVHIIGQIQPHGMLFAISEPDLIVRQVSLNVSKLLGLAPETILDHSFETVLGAQQFEIFRSLTLSHEPLEENPIRMRLAGRALEVQCLAHRQDGVLVVELELPEGAHSLEAYNLNVRIRVPLSRLELASGIPELSELTTSEIRRISGFDRVMVYRFDEDWNGEVIAESAVPSPVSYLGLRFPAADIPSQARRLFLLNRLRAIVDIEAPPVPIVPEIGPLTGRPLDLTCSFLRSPAPVHLEYLRNMGVQSSLTVSIIAGQQLWGMIACHHASPRHVDDSVRSACELFGQMLGSQVALRMSNAALQQQIASRALLHSYLAELDAITSLAYLDPLLNHRLLELFSADGLVLCLGGVISTQGHTLEPKTLLPVIDRLRELSLEAQRARPGAAKEERNSPALGAASLTPRPSCASSLEAQRARLVAAKEERNSPALGAESLTPRPSCASSLEGIASSNMLSALDPSAVSYAREISGALYLGLDEESSDYLLLLRRELATTVTWAGNPDKSVNTDAQGRLHPRASFQAWQENVRARSRPWTELELELAHSLRVHLIQRKAIAGFLAAAIETSAREQAEAASRASDEHFRLIVEAVEDYALIMLDTAGHVISWNVGAERIHGYTAGEIIGRHFSIFYVPKDIERRHPEDELHIAARLGRYSEEGSRIRKDGSHFLADVVIAAVHDEAGKVRGFAKVVHDITERKRAEDQLKTASRRLNLATSALHAGIWDWDVRTNLVVWDQRMFEIYGIPADTQITYPIWKSAVVPADLAASEAVLQKVVASKSEASMEFRITLPDGSLRYIQAAEGVILDDAGEVARIIGINIDTTDRKFNEDLERQVAQRTAQLKSANEELEQFAYVVAHDLKAPLRAIDNSAEWLEEDLAEHLTDETREHLNMLRGRVRRMDKLQDDLLEYARVGRATDNRYAETIRGDLLMEDVLALLPLRGFTVEVSPGFANIEVCRMPLQQILMNLIGNAIKHHHKKTGKIAVTIDNSDQFYAFAVKDDGPGIGAPFHNQVFEMFRTLRPRDQVEGSGIGLAIVRKHIEIAGGTLHLESAEGQGSTFRFTWPKRQQKTKEVE